MREYVKDRDGDVWQRSGADSWYSPGLVVRTRLQVEQEFGPVTPCDAHGNPLTLDTDTRALLADAFEDFARRSVALRTDSRWNERHEIAARETAAALRSGEIG
jgi:hypothetical protein